MTFHHARLIQAVVYLQDRTLHFALHEDGSWQPDHPLAFDCFHRIPVRNTLSKTCVHELSKLYQDSSFYVHPHDMTRIGAAAYIVRVAGNLNDDGYRRQRVCRHCNAFCLHAGRVAPAWHHSHCRPCFACSLQCSQLLSCLLFIFVSYMCC